MVENWPPKIESGIKPHRNSGKRDWSFIRGMNIGDSVFVQGLSTADVGLFWKNAENIGYQLESHNWEQDGTRGVRIWRKS